jgi:hypothetical protein
MAKITYANKITLIEHTQLKPEEIFSADDANEIKNSINALYDLVNNSYKQSIIFNTYQDLLNYTFTSQPLDIDVIIDENKGQENTAYSWNGFKLKWKAEVENEYQPTT